MTYRILFDELVLKEDLPRFDPPAQKRILKAIRRKLTTAPESFGKPLAGKLKGLWRLRVGDYRIIYKIWNDRVVVYVVMIGYRRDAEVYWEIAGRLGLR